LDLKPIGFQVKKERTGQTMGKRSYRMEVLKYHALGVDRDAWGNHV
jgi:hypothetical protein